jgi:hypothetical protein
MNTATTQQQERFSRGDTVRIISNPLESFGVGPAVGSIAKVTSDGAHIVGIKCGKFSCRAWLVIDGHGNQTIERVR